MSDSSPGSGSHPGAGKRGLDTLGPAVAGRWYPADADALRSEVDQLLSDATARHPASPSGHVVALIAPHAGFVFSGAVAAAGFRLVRDRPVSRVILLGPSHYHAFEGATVTRARSYRTPLGEIDLDTDALDNLGAHRSFRVDDTPFLPEHSLEAELPFLQRVLRPGWQLVPVLIGLVPSTDVATELAACLADLVRDDTLFVVSSDFTHYGSGFGYVPFSDDVPRRIRELDLNAVEQIVGGDVRGFEDYLDRTAATICGRNPIRILMRALPKAYRAELVEYDTSGRQTGDWSHTVSYASLAFLAGAREC